MIEDFTDTRHRTYVVVSATWKQAIESLEPDTHQFLPHTFQFTDGVVDGHFILRLGGTLDLQLPSFNADAVEDRFEQIIGYALTVGGRLGTITLDRATVGGASSDPLGSPQWVYRVAPAGRDAVSAAAGRDRLRAAGDIRRR